MATLVTGATGDLGTPTAAALRAAGHDVRAMSRRTGPGLTTADLLTGEGLAAAVEGAETVVHCATAQSAGDVDAARNLFTAAREAGVGHVVLISIVGIDAIPLPFYRQRLEIEELLRASGLAHTIQRATQFHSLIDRLFATQRRLPVLLVPRVSAQPIGVGDVAARLTALAGAAPAGRAPDIGGPERMPGARMAGLWQEAAGVHRPPWFVSLPGRTFAALKRGENLVPGPPYGTDTFAGYLQRTYRG